MENSGKIGIIIMSIFALVNGAMALNVSIKYYANVIETLKTLHPEYKEIPTSTILAIIDVESGFHTNAVGNAGEIGLMQIKPGTGSWINPGADLYNDIENIETGIKFLLWLKRRIGFPGYIQAYNTGLAGYKKGIRNNYPIKVFTKKAKYLVYDIL